MPITVDPGVVISGVVIVATVVTSHVRLSTASKYRDKANIEDHGRIFDELVEIKKKIFNGDFVRKDELGHNK